MFIISRLLRPERSAHEAKEEELQRRFKRFCNVRQGNEETIYFNDGSIDGKRIVTFVKKDLPFDAENFTLGYEETYY